MLGIVRDRRSLLAAALFLLSAFVVTFKLVNPARFELAVNVDGGIVMTEVPQVYGVGDVLTVLAFALVLGVAGCYLALPMRRVQESTMTAAESGGSPDASEPEAATDVTPVIARLLEGETRNVYREILKRGGEILQRELVLESNLPKATVSRTLASLEGRGLIVRTPYGLTNKVTAVRGLKELLAR